MLNAVGAVYLEL